MKSSSYRRMVCLSGSLMIGIRLAHASTESSSGVYACCFDRLLYSKVRRQTYVVSYQYDNMDEIKVTFSQRPDAFFRTSPYVGDADSTQEIFIHKGSLVDEHTNEQYINDSNETLLEYLHIDISKASNDQRFKEATYSNQKYVIETENAWGAIDEGVLEQARITGNVDDESLRQSQTLKKTLITLKLKNGIVRPVEESKPCESSSEEKIVGTGTFKIKKNKKTIHFKYTQYLDRLEFENTTQSTEQLGTEEWVYDNSFPSVVMFRDALCKRFGFKKPKKMGTFGYHR